LLEAFFILQGDEGVGGNASIIEFDEFGNICFLPDLEGKARIGLSQEAFVDRRERFQEMDNAWDVRLRHFLHPCTSTIIKKIFNESFTKFIR